MRRALENPPNWRDLPLGLYIHLPWCRHKCPYCDFNSHALNEPLPEGRYLGALLADLELDLARFPEIAERPIETVFIGGGTPSLFSAAAIGDLLAGVQQRVKLAPGTEITMEANPGTLPGGRLGDYAAAGVTRLSLGLQSLDDGHLRALGRIHDARQALAAAQEAALAGFASYNLDLMYGLPGQDGAGFAGELHELLALRAPHLSLYQLTVEPRTAFARNPPPLPDGDAVAAMEEAIATTLTAAGYRHYEISAHARSAGQDHACRHNLNYWRFGDYLGIGAGAHGKVTTSQGIVRTKKTSAPGRYMAFSRPGGQPRLPEEPAAVRWLTADDLVVEFALNALRLRDGFPLGLFQRHTGLDPAAIAAPLARAQALGLLDHTDGHCQPTPRGQRYLNDLLLLFLPDAGMDDPARVGGDGVPAQASGYSG